MTLSSNPSYQALAATAASSLGNPTSAIVKAILAQWQCELGNVSYPPTRNNPGNIAKGWADAVGIPYTVHFPNPQPGNPIVTYGSANDGARAYAGGLRTFRRYAGVRAAVSRGDGRAFLLAITAAGYGTNVVCALRVYGGETGTVQTTPAPVGIPVSTGGATDAELWAKINAVLRRAGVSIDPNHVINAPEAEAIGRADSEGLFFSGGVGLEGKTVSQLLDVARSRAGSIGGQVQNAVGDAIGALPGEIGDVLRGLLVNGGMLLLILFLAFSGFRDVLNGDG